MCLLPPFGCRKDGFGEDVGGEIDKSGIAFVDELWRCVSTKSNGVDCKTTTAMTTRQFVLISLSFCLHGSFCGEKTNFIRMCVGVMFKL